VLDLRLPAFGNSQALLEVDVPIYLIALNFNDAVDVLVEFDYFSDRVRNRSPAFAGFKVVEDTVDDLR